MRSVTGGDNSSVSRRPSTRNCSGDGRPFQSPGERACQATAHSAPARCPRGSQVQVRRTVPAHRPDLHGGLPDSGGEGAGADLGCSHEHQQCAARPTEGPLASRTSGAAPPSGPSPLRRRAMFRRALRRPGPGSAHGTPGGCPRHRPAREVM